METSFLPSDTCSTASSRGLSTPGHETTRGTGSKDLLLWLEIWELSVLVGLVIDFIKLSLLRAFFFRGWPWLKSSLSCPQKAQPFPVSASSTLVSFLTLCRQLNQGIFLVRAEKAEKISWQMFISCWLPKCGKFAPVFFYCFLLKAKYNSFSRDFWLAGAKNATWFTLNVERMSGLCRAGGICCLSPAAQVGTLLPTASWYQSGQGKQNTAKHWMEQAFLIQRREKERSASAVGVGPQGHGGLPAADPGCIFPHLVLQLEDSVL